MPETRVKVYRTAAEMQADVADATAHGWRVTEQRPRADGTTSVTFAQGSEWSATPAGTPAPEVVVRQGMDTGQKAFAEAFGAIAMLVFLWWLLGSPSLDSVLEWFRSVGGAMFGS